MFAIKIKPLDDVTADVQQQVGLTYIKQKYYCYCVDTIRNFYSICQFIQLQIRN